MACVGKVMYSDIVSHEEVYNTTKSLINWLYISGSESVYTLDQFFFGFDSYVFAHLLGHLAEERFNEVRPRVMLRCKYELEAALNSGQIFDDLPVIL